MKKRTESRSAPRSKNPPPNSINKAAERGKTAAKAAEKMLRTGKLSAEEVAGCLTDISLAEIREIEKELLQTS